MTANANAKLKLLYIREMLEQQTDREHGLTMKQIIERLNERGIQAERKSVYRDLDLLREVGLDIRTYQRNPVEYAIERRCFTIPELMLMIDAVQSSRFVTKLQCDKLVRNIKTLASENQRELLNKRIHVAGRIKSKNESVFGTIDVIHEAMRQRKKISFHYYKHDSSGQPVVQHNGKPYVLTPVKIVYADGFYYLDVWSDTHKGFSDYRIDRMKTVRVSDEPATRSAEITARANEDCDYQYFGRFNGETVAVTLDVEPDKIDIVLDRFGEDATFAPAEDGDHAQAQVCVKKSQQFFGWVAGLGGTVTIASPESLAEEYRDYLRGLIENS